jgi:hypothetical protein
MVDVRAHGPAAARSQPSDLLRLLGDDVEPDVVDEEEGGGDQ